MELEYTLEELLNNEVSSYMKYASIKKSLLERKNINKEMIAECDKRIGESERLIAEYNQELLSQSDSIKPNINRQMLIRREAYYG